MKKSLKSQPFLTLCPIKTLLTIIAITLGSRTSADAIVNIPLGHADITDVEAPATINGTP